MKQLNRRLTKYPDLGRSEKSLEKAKCIAYLAVTFLIFMVFANLSLFFNTIFFSTPSPSVGIVDAEALVRFENEYEAAAFPEEVVLETDREQILVGLKKQIALFAEKQKVILLEKGVILGGEVPDYTEELLEHLQEAKNE